MSVRRTSSRARSAGLGPDAPQEDELIARVSKRDLLAFETLYRIYQPRLTRFLTTLVRRAEVVEEVLDDTMMVVWQTAGSFRGTSKLSTWIFAIAYRKAVRSKGRWPDPVEDEPRGLTMDPEPGPDQQLQQSRLHDALFAAMDSLSADHRAVVDLTYFHGMGYREIAQIMDCPVDTVKTRMFHARRRLRDAMPACVADWL